MVSKELRTALSNLGTVLERLEEACRKIPGATRTYLDIDDCTGINGEPEQLLAFSGARFFIINACDSDLRAPLHDCSTVLRLNVMKKIPEFMELARAKEAVLIKEAEDLAGDLEQVLIDA